MAALKIGGTKGITDTMSRNLSSGLNDSVGGRKYVKYDEIVVNDLNKDFSQEDAEAIKESILEIGLMHELAVVIDKKTKKYRLISGEQRYRAIGLMTPEERSSSFPSGIPVNVLKSMDSKESEEATIIEANLISRSYSPEEYKKHMLRLIELYEKKKADGEIKSIVKMLKEKAGVEERQAKRYIAAGKVVPQLKEALIKGQIDLKETEKFSSLTEDTQLQIAELLEDKNGSKFTQEDLEKIHELDEVNLKLANAQEQIKEKESEISKLKDFIKIAEKKNADIENEDSYVKQLTERIKQLEEELSKTEMEKEVHEEEKKDKKKKLEAIKNEFLEPEEELEGEMAKSRKEYEKAEKAVSNLFAALKKVNKLKETINIYPSLREKYKEIVESIDSDLI